MDALELLMTEAYDDGVVTAVIRPAAVVTEEAAREILVELGLRDVRSGGCWNSEPTIWRRYGKAWDGVDDGPGHAELLGTMQIAYGVPTRYEITVYRATVTALGNRDGWTVTSLCDEALSFGGLSLASCPRTELAAPPRPFVAGR